jgi:steroid delta-isomerase-like uncharacterized protein
VDARDSKLNPRTESILIDRSLNVSYIEKQLIPRSGARNGMSDMQADAVDDEVELVRLIKECVASWSAHDMGRVAAQFTDCTYEDVATGDVNRGHHELIQFGEGIFAMAPDVNYQIESTIAVGDRGFAQWVMTGTYTGEVPGFPPPSGGRFRVRDTSAYEVRDGRLSRCSDYWDVATLLRQLGHTS